MLCEESTLDLASDIDGHCDFKKNATAVFVDIRKAYDNLSSLVVACRLDDLGATGQAQAFISDLLYNSSIRVRSVRVLSEIRILATLEVASQFY